ncbi:ABC transporter permease [Neorhizobium galegae]|uniref:ABC di/oligopeptide transporter n=1 Tax=Neorhizobium galegae bv. orientalis str. HAMBI 540 TaxID=1028800 RepID=A0A068T3Z1_NEOGA|nr:ABC transporter permease [Neorhizobium galegae]MCQ1853256.1 ABC transporter permease [Neorhizobium galegae]CDN52115.1 ABC di/oligopeptide transporter [Neorhizobium galegae bv. orientalis str. HAMBI 540]CDZ53350.1 ABC-type dipeptide/oligopeptide/nickel transport system, permease component [Neorhizobium galegae bv. orientalis]
MGSFIYKRSLQSLLSLIGLIVLVFFLARITGSPVDLYLPQGASQEIRNQFNEQFGFNDPLYIQFGRFIWGLVHLDMGQSLQFSRPATEIVLQAFPTTLMLAAVTMPLVIVIAVVTGSLAAFKPGGIFDRLASFISLLGASTPNFWVAIVGVLVFAVTLRVLPTSGTGTPLHWVLPVAVLALRPAGVLVQVVRTSMLTALSSAYIKTARAKGVGSRAIVFVHALRNGLLPVITVASDQTAGIVNGAVIVETVFGFPGIGKLMIDSVMQRDFAVIQAAVLVTALAVFIINILVDITYAIVDPRIRYN